MHNNKKRKIKTGILQGLLVLPIFFLIYISRVFNAVRKNNPAVTFLSFVNIIRFIVSDILVKNIFQALGTVASIVLH